MRKTVFYIAGPIAGTDDYKERFREAEEIYQLRGDSEHCQVVLNPVRILEGVEDRDCLPICLQLIEQADMVILLPGWDKSLGATTEALYALRQGKDVFERIRGNLHTAVYWEEGALKRGAKND